MKHISPLPRYPGSKKAHKEKLWDGQIADVLLEPFAGAAHHSFYRLNQGPILAPRFLFWGEADASVRAIYQAWQTPELHDLVYENLENIRFAFTLGEAKKEYKQLTRQWHVLTDRYCGINFSIDDLATLAAVSLAIRKLTFGGIVRTNKGGKLNMPMCDCQLMPLIGWDYRFPELPDCRIDVSGDYTGAIAAFSLTSLATADALIDPPYWTPDRGLTGCYPGHNPHGDTEFFRYGDALDRCLQNERIRRIVITGYYSKELDESLRTVAAQHGVDLGCEMNGTLAAMQKGKEITTKNREHIWVALRTAKTLIPVSSQPCYSGGH